MNATKILPWGLCRILAGVCWQQQLKHGEYQRGYQQKIASLEQEKQALVKESSMNSSKVRGTKKIEPVEVTPNLPKGIHSLKKVR